jgi:hypothetical protein
MLAAGRSISSPTLPGFRDRCWTGGRRFGKKWPDEVSSPKRPRLGFAPKAPPHRLISRFMAGPMRDSTRFDYALGGAENAENTCMRDVRKDPAFEVGAGRVTFRRAD